MNLIPRKLSRLLTRRRRLGPWWRGRHAGGFLHGINCTCYSCTCLCGTPTTAPCSICPCVSDKIGVAISSNTNCCAYGSPGSGVSYKITGYNHNKSAVLTFTASPPSICSIASFPCVWEFDDTLNTATLNKYATEDCTGVAIAVELVTIKWFAFIVATGVGSNHVFGFNSLFQSTVLLPSTPSCEQYIATLTSAEQNPNLNAGCTNIPRTYSYLNCVATGAGSNRFGGGATATFDFCL